jgi:hypothetical protein
MIDGHQYRIEDLASIELIRIWITVCVGVSNLDCTVDAARLKICECKEGTERRTIQPSQGTTLLEPLSCQASPP